MHSCHVSHFTKHRNIFISAKLCPPEYNSHNSQLSKSYMQNYPWNKATIGRHCYDGLYDVTMTMILISDSYTIGFKPQTWNIMETFTCPLTKNTRGAT